MLFIIVKLSGTSIPRGLQQNNIIDICRRFLVVALWKRRPSILSTITSISYLFMANLTNNLNLKSCLWLWMSCSILLTKPQGACHSHGKKACYLIALPISRSCRGTTDVFSPSSCPRVHSTGNMHAVLRYLPHAKKSLAWSLRQQPSMAWALDFDLIEASRFSVYQCS